MKNYNKNRRNKNSMTQDYDSIRLMIRIMIVTKNENNDQNGINNNENNTGNDTDDGIVSIIRMIMIGMT